MGLIPDISGIADSASKALENIKAETMALISEPLSSITSSLPDAATEIFSKINPDAASLATTLLDFGKKEVSDKIKSLASDTGGALSNPISFISKALSDTVNGTGSLSSAIGNVNKLVTSGMQEVEKALGTVLETPGEVLGAIKDVTSNIGNSVGKCMKDITTAVGSPFSSISDIVSSATNAVKSVKKTISSGIQTIDSTISSISSATKSAIGTASRVLSADSIISQAKNTFSSVIDTVVNKTASQWSSISNSLMETYNGNSTVRELSKIADSDTVIGAIGNLKNSSSYPLVTDSNGASLTESYGTATASEVKSMYSLAAKTTSVVHSNTGIVNYREKKDLTDVLLQVAAEKGMTDLVKKLSTKAEGSICYFDSRSESLLSNKSRSVAQNGDVNMYQTILDLVGQSKISDIDNDLRALCANASLNDIEKIKNIFTSIGSSPEKIYSEEYCGRSVLNGSICHSLANKNSGVLDEFLSTDIRKLVQTATYIYA